MNATKILAVTAAAAALAAGSAACGTTVQKVKPAAATTENTQPTQPAQTSAAATTAPATPSLTGPVGTAFSVTDGSIVYHVILTKIIDPAAGGDAYTTPTSGDKFIGAVFTLKGVTGNEQDDANSDASMTGSNGQVYTADFDAIAGYTNFNNGSFSTVPGGSIVGAITFQIPVGVTVANVQWSAGLDGQPATWTP